MLLLALDTSTTAVTVALHDGDRLIAEATTLDARAHAEQLAPGLAKVLVEAGAEPGDVTDVVGGLGPGPFTGLRVGLVTARTFAMATGARLLGVCSLDALAHEAYAAHGATEEEIIVATDARRKEVYWARYAPPGHNATATRLAGPAVARPADLPSDVAALATVGRGPLLYPDTLGSGGQQGGDTARILLDVSAGWLADLVVRRLAAGEAVDEHEPYYLRRPDAAPSVTTKSALW